MDRRKALAAAGAVSLTAAAAAAAVGANFGLFGLTGQRGAVGKLSPVSATEIGAGAPASPAATLPPEVQTIYVDEQATSPRTASLSATPSRESEPERTNSIEPVPPPEPAADKADPTPSTTSTTSSGLHDDHAEEPGHDHEPDD